MPTWSQLTNLQTPPFHKWINFLLETLHQDPEMKRLCPRIPIVTGQPPRVASLALKSKHWQSPYSSVPDVRPPGCHTLHRQKNGVCFSRMEDMRDKVKSCKTASPPGWYIQWSVLTARCSMWVKPSRQWHRDTIVTEVRWEVGQIVWANSSETPRSRPWPCKERRSDPFHLQIIARVKPPETPKEEPACRQRLETFRWTCSTG